MAEVRCRAWTRGSAPWLGALAIHAAIFALLGRHAPSPPPRSSADAPVDAIEIAVGVEAAAREGAPVDSSPATAVAGPSKPSTRGPTAARTTSTPIAGPTEPMAHEPAGAPAPEGGDGIALGPPIDIGIGLGKPGLLLPKMEADVDRKVAIERALRDPAREREQSLGLGPEGPVLTALAASTSQSLAPVKGKAVFVVKTNAEGDVVDIELQEAEGGRPGWADAGRIAREALDGKKLRLPPGVKRMVMKIEVTSAWKLPSGQDPGTDVELFGRSIAKGEGKDSGKVTILDPIPKLRVEEVDLGSGVKLRVPTIEIDIFRATVDPTNIGAKPRRVVHTRLVESQAI